MASSNSQMSSRLAWVLAIGCSIALGNAVAYGFAVLMQALSLGGFPNFVGVIIVLGVAIIAVRPIENFVRRWGYDLPSRENETGLQTASREVDDSISEAASEALRSAVERETNGTKKP